LFVLFFFKLTSRVVEVVARLESSLTETLEGLDSAAAASSFEGGGVGGVGGGEAPATYNDDDDGLFDYSLGMGIGAGSQAGKGNRKRSAAVGGRNSTHSAQSNTTGTQRLFEMLLQHTTGLKQELRTCQQGARQEMARHVMRPSSPSSDDHDPLLSGSPLLVGKQARTRLRRPSELKKRSDQDYWRR